MASSSRARSSSPFSHRKPSTPYSSTSSSSSLMNGRLMPRSCSSTASSFFNSGGRSMTPSRGRSESSYQGPRGRSPVAFGTEESILEPVDTSSSGDSISVTNRFRPLSEREYQRGDEIAWYADGDKIVRNEYNPATAYAFDKVFGPHTISEEVYEVAAKPVVKAAMEGVNGTVFAYGVTSSGKTHTMHASKKSRHRKHRTWRSSGISIDAEFLKKHVEDSRVDPIEAALRLFRHLADVSKLQRVEAENQAKGALAERDDERKIRVELQKKYELLSSTLLKSQEDQTALKAVVHKLERERDSALNQCMEHEVRISDLESQGRQSEEVISSLKARISELKADILKARQAQPGTSVDSPPRIAKLEKELQEARAKAEAVENEMVEVAQMAMDVAGESYEKALAQVAVIHPSLPLDREILRVEHIVEGGQIVKLSPDSEECEVIYPRPSLS